MIGEYAPDSGVGSKKRSLTSPGNIAVSEGSMMSPPTKKMKQARLPFKVISSPSPNQCDKPVATNPLPSKKRKLSSPHTSQTASHSTKVKSTDAKSSAKKPADNPPKKFFVKKGSSSPVTPKNVRVETINLDPEVSSSCEDQESNKLTSSSVTPKRSLASKPKSLDGFLQTTQQPQVSTSDDVFELSDDDVLIVIDEESPGEENYDDPSATETVDANVASSHQEGSQAATLSEKTSSAPASEMEKTSDDKDCQVEMEESMSEMDVSMMSCPDDSTAASKLSYDADSEDGDGEDDEEPRTVKSSEGSSEAESSTGNSPSNTGPTTPRGVAKPVRKTPLSAKALKKLQEKEKLREDKLKLRMEKKRKLQEEEAERKRQKLDMKKEKEREREETRKQKEMEKDVKRKERQQKKDEEEKEKEQRRMAKEEEKKKKQENIDAKMEEKRKKNEERQRQEDEKKKQEEEKREKDARQKNFFKSFFKEAVVPVKKPQEKSSGWFAPFHVKDDMVLAPVRRCQKLPEALKELDTAFQNQNSSSLYLDELKGKMYVVGKMSRTPQGESEESSSRAVTPSMEKMQQDGDSQDVQLVSETPTQPDKKLVRMKCKLLQFHENYRPAYYGTWRQTSLMINPRNYLKKDADLLDYEVDSDDEWEEPGESLSHSEGEDDGEEVDDGGDSDDGFFVPHGYLSESEGCEDDEELENWKERRAAKAKSWEVELKRQQGVLKAVLIGCIWATKSQPSTNKMLDAYKAVALTTVPIDTRSKKQVAAANEAQSAEDSSKTSMHPRGQCSELGTSLKRPVPAEAMPDLIRLVHGNTAGIKTLQREFREYWRLKDMSKKSGQTTPRPETPMAAEANQSVKTSLEEPRIVGIESPLPGPTGADIKTPVFNELDPYTKSPSVQTPGRQSTPVTDGGTPEPANAGQSSPANPTGDAIECSISKRQLMITINDIAVREKRPQFPRTCWYVHQHVLEKYNQQNLPIPCQWQNITKPQKTLRAESPLVGHSLPVYGTQTTSGYSVPKQGGYTAVVIQQNPVLLGSAQHTVQPGVYVPNSSMHLPLGVTQGNTIPPHTAASSLNTLTGLNPQTAILQPSNVALPFQLQVTNGMSASEIMQRLSATVPIQQNQTPPTLSANPAHMFNPITPNQMHYLDMLPKPRVIPNPQTVRITTSQMNNDGTSYAVTVPRTSPNDIKAMLSSHAARPTASPTGTNVRSDSKPTLAAPEATSAPSPAGPKDEPCPALTQKPAVKTLKSFFNVKPLPKSSLTDQTVVSSSCSESKKLDKSLDKTISVMENKNTALPESTDEKEKLPSCTEDGQEKVERQEEMEVIEIN